MKKKVISTMLALTLVLSEIPVYTSYAAEISEDNVEAVENDEPESANVTTTAESNEATNGETDTATTAESDEATNGETDTATTAESDEVTTGEVTSLKVAEKRQSPDDYYFNVAGNGKAVGTDGVLYDDVVYLSAATVNALDEDIQSVYFEVCDSIAELKAQEDALNGAVIAVDEDGNLHYSLSVPTIRLAEGNLFSESSNETETVLSTETVDALESEEISTEDAVSKETSSEEINSEESSSEDLSTEETDTEKSSSEEISSEESSTEESSSEDLSTEETDTEESSTEEISSEESSTEETDTEESSIEDVSTEEIETEGVSTEEPEDETENASTEVETETEDSAEYVFSAENMDLLENGEEKTFDVIENVKVDSIVDLGYGSGFSNYNSTLASKTYFKDQLDSVEKKIYDAGIQKLTKGTNKFDFNYPMNTIKADHEAGKVHARAFQAVSAIIMQYPYEMDWMDLSPVGKTVINVYVYKINGKEYYAGKFEFETDVSPYYNSSLVNQANAQINKLAAEAQEYALANYPNDVVYGIVKYFDSWICKTNYYDMIGTTTPDKWTTLSDVQKEAYFYCHSSYGILLKGYGVCESYALAMTRLLDAMGIPNMYAVGDTPGGGHAWNYVAMPDGKWYLQDSTWNDNTDPQHVVSDENYLLCADDGYHIPTGSRWVLNTGDFKFVDVNKENYNATNGGILNIKECNLKVKETAQLDISAYYGKIYASSITSSNPKVAKVDKNGKITAVSGGQAKITVTYNLPSMQLSDTCTVNVYQLKSLVSERTNKTSDTVSLGLQEANPKKVTLNANCGEGIDVATMINNNFIEQPTVVSPSKNVADIKIGEISGNSIELEIRPTAQGTASYKIKLGTKSVTLKVSVGDTIVDQNYFDVTAAYITKPENNGNIHYLGTTPYTGKALKPKVTKKADAPKDLKFKTTYYNNKAAGTASIVISGTGKYAGEETFTFEIEPLQLTKDVVKPTLKQSSSAVYNGGVNQAKATVKYAEGKTKLSLKIGVDYDIIYRMENGEETKTPQNVGKYTVFAIEGKGSFTGKYEVNSGITYEIKPLSDKKVKVSLTSVCDAIVKSGKIELPKSDYVVEYYKDKRCVAEKLSNKPALKGTYYVKVTASDTGNLSSNGGKITTLKIK